MNFGTLGTGFGGMGRGGAGAGFEAEAVTLFAAMSVQPSDARKSLINSMIVSLKSGGIWDRFSTLWITAAHDAQAARLNWKAPGSFALTAVNSPTFTTDRGYAGNGTTSYLDTGWDPSNNGGGVYTQNNAHIAVWNRTSRAINTSCALGQVTTGGAINMFLRYTGGLVFTRVNDATSGGLAVAGSSGLTLGDRTNSTTITIYKDGTSLGNPSSATSDVLSTTDLYIGGYNFGGTLVSPTSDEFAAVSFGASLGSLQGSYYTILQTYLTAVGAA